ncbi:MAG: DNA polymerase III subunit delta' [Pirellulales bacterium]|nr:DNA polymerase III subunit delta' [Pirellulales bacterium]
MPWQSLERHDLVAAKFRRALEQERLASTFLFVGPDGIGKRAFAIRLAQSLLCRMRDEKLLDPCGHCAACSQVLAGTHPDLISVNKPAGKSEIPVGMLKGDDDYPVEQSLLFNLSMRPFYGGRKIAILDDADSLNAAGANALLKTLEEPPPRSVLILISASADRQLPTIRSRAQIVRFNPLPVELVSRLLMQRGLVQTADEADRLAAFSAGSLTRAAELADPGIWSFRGELLQWLCQSPLPSIAMSQATMKFVDEAGKEAPLRRARLRLVIGFASDFFRQLMRGLSGLAIDGDSELKLAVERAALSNAWNVESAAESADRCLEALAHIDRNANQSTLIEAWMDDLLTWSRPQEVGSRR